MAGLLAPQREQGLLAAVDYLKPGAGRTLSPLEAIFQFDQANKQASGALAATQGQMPSNFIEMLRNRPDPRQEARSVNPVHPYIASAAQYTRENPILNLLGGGYMDMLDQISGGTPTASGVAMGALDIPGLAELGPQLGIGALVGGLGKFGKTLPQGVSPFDELAQGVLPPAQRGFDLPPLPNKQVVPQPLTAAEEKLLRRWGEGKRGILENQIAGYREVYPPDEGWKLAEANKAAWIAGKKGKAGKPVVSYDPTGGFDFHLSDEGIQLGPQDRAARVRSMSDAIVQDVEDVMRRAQTGDPNARAIVNQGKWYEDARATIAKAVGEENVPMYAQMQGAFSPNTALGVNFKNADTVFHRFLKGDFDNALNAMDEDIANGGTVGSFMKDRGVKEFPELYARIDPKTGKGVKYGMNMDNGMMAMRDLMRETGPGQAPKMRNYAENIEGTSNRPTIDVWAARSLQRLAGRPRVVPAINKIPGEWASPGSYDASQSHRLTSPYNYQPGVKPDEKSLFKREGNMPVLDRTQEFKGPDVTNAYGVGMDVYEDAAARLGMDPKNLQAMMWFREKELWEIPGWTPRKAAREGDDLTGLIAQKYGIDR